MVFSIRGRDLAAASGFFHSAWIAAWAPHALTPRGDVSSAVLLSFSDYFGFFCVSHRGAAAAFPRVCVS